MNKIKKIGPPKAKKIPFESNHHNNKLVDQYHWIRDDNWQEVLHSPKVLKKEIREYIDKENQWTDSHLSILSSDKEQIYNEIKGRIKEEDSSLPQKDGSWFYFSETKRGQEYSILKRYKNKLSINFIYSFGESSVFKFLCFFL